MNTNLARYWALSGLALLSPALAGCGNDQQVGTDTANNETSTGDTTGEPTTTTTTTSVPTTTDVTVTGMSATETTTSTTVEPTSTSSTTTSDTTTSESTSTGPVSGTTGVDMCMTILCGEPAVCCGAGDECVDGACLPLCESGIRCGDDKSICCDAGAVCLGDVCQQPLGPCADSYDCEPGEYCEPIFGQCLPQPDPLDCEVVPTFDDIEPQLEWAWTTNEVISLPIIADVDGDGKPDVVVNTTRVDNMAASYHVGEIVLLDGTTGQEKWRITHDPAMMKFGSHGRSSVAVADVSGDGLPDIIYAGRQEGAKNVGPVHAVDGMGAFLWTSRLPNNTTAKFRIEHGSATVVNLDNDPEAEIAFGASLLDHDGLMVWNQPWNGEANQHGSMYGTPMSGNNPIYNGGLATFADLDGDTKPELITGRDAWKIEWVPGNPPSVTMTLFWSNKTNPVNSHNNDGWPAVADLDGDGKPEVVLVAWPAIRVINGQTGTLWCGVDPTDAACIANPALRTQPIAIKGGDLGGPATIADFDGDGRPEAGIAGGIRYAVYDFNRPGFAGDNVAETIVKVDMAAPASGAMYARWVATTQDDSSAATGSSVFDFQGDGKAEVAYQDECFARVYDGASGAVQLQIMNSSATIHEYPLVADLDGDGNSEFVVVANFAEPANITACQNKTPGFTARKGVFVYGAGGDNWVPTRKVWTQHTYHVTDADSAGNPPMSEEANWTVASLNNFRQNVQGEGVFNAADLTVSLAADLNDCSDALVLVATIYNEGALGVPPGIDVSFHEGTDNTGVKLGVKPTSEQILPGGSTQVKWEVKPPPDKNNKKNFFAEIDPGNDDGLIQECNEDNNGAVVTEAFCPEAG
ncbi:FG-GAP repeat domain-containing protein [Nannocystis radixulma]|uniref:VCBS repeat-containing protein n=1 Tax=Nannocystis radixulma TaxID=2995305 RepID=A0ABT5B0Y4_9BACT|nr:VCBS repeat-containing protein [Nannocystis radixulma]MDC0666832.1 VCBS repeat-containing protein [Nannocystis radixulma]